MQVSFCCQFCKFKMFLPRRPCCLPLPSSQNFRHFTFDETGGGLFITIHQRLRNIYVWMYVCMRVCVVKICRKSFKRCFSRSPTLISLFVCVCVCAYSREILLNTQANIQKLIFFFNTFLYVCSMLEGMRQFEMRQFPQWLGLFPTLDINGVQSEHQLLDKKID